MKQAPYKQNLVVETPAPKVAMKKLEAKVSFGKFMPNRERNKNNSSVGPSWGGRKGN